MWQLLTRRIDGPCLRMQRRLELVGAEYARFVFGRGHFEYESDLELRPLKIQDAHSMDSGTEADGAARIPWRMHSVVVNHQLIVDIEPRAIVRGQTENVGPGLSIQNRPS